MAPPRAIELSVLLSLKGRILEQEETKRTEIVSVSSVFYCSNRSRFYAPHDLSHVRPVKELVNGQVIFFTAN